MGQALTINPRIIEGLYCEALVLSDEVRAAFDLARRFGDSHDEEDLARVALSCEALRTTTRMMHAIAWLLNHRAFHKGELSEFHLRRHSGLSANFPGSDPERIALIDEPTRTLIAATESFYARLVRIDRIWRERDTHGPSAIAAVRQRMAEVSCL